MRNTQISIKSRSISRMQKVSVILTIIDIALILGPIAGVVLLSDGNWQEMIIPPELGDLVSGSSNPLNQTNLGGILGNSSNPQDQLKISAPTVSNVDLTARTVAFTFNFTNPLAIDLTLESFNGTVRCVKHQFPLGTAALNNAVEVKASQITSVSVTFAWTQAAQEHFASAHTGASTIDVQIINPTVNLSGIVLQLTEPINVPDVPLQQVVG